MPIDLGNARVLVVGAGLMGTGIAQVAALAGHRVQLVDARDGVAGEARGRLAATLHGLAAKGRLAAESAQAAIERIEPLPALAAARDADLVIEAIVEQLDAKRTVLRALEAQLGPDVVLATNTSSFSVTALAQGLARPERVVGMHFFNPVPAMRLVEVVSGLQTAGAVADAVFGLARQWGKSPVHARSTPGFVVNRIARPYYAEALALLHEQAATPPVIDACLKAAGFRMGPCELMDLIGHDINYAVTLAIYEASFHDRRYAPSALQREMVAGGRLGRKSGRGFYDHASGAGTPAAAVAMYDAPPAAAQVVVHGDGPVADHLERAATGALAPQGWGPARERGSGWTGVSVDQARLVMTDGRTAQSRAVEFGTRELAVFDRPLAQPVAHGTALAWAAAPGASEDWAARAPAWLAALGFTPLRVADAPGLVVARTLAMLIDEAADAVLQGVCSVEGADLAMKLGVNWPAGPFEWLDDWGVAGVIDVLHALDREYRGERYRVSPWLRRRSGR